MGKNEKNKDFKKGAYFKIDVLNAKKNGNKIPLQQKEKKLVIIHPSLACPEIIKEGDPIHIYVMADDNFHNTAKLDNTKLDKTGNQSSINLRRSIAHRLKIQSFDAALVGKKSSTEEDDPLFDNIDKALDNIEIHHIGTADDKTTIKNKKFGEKFNGIIREDTRRLYGSKGLKHIYQIIIHNHNKTAGEVKKSSSKGTLFDLSWISYDDAHKKAKDEGPYIERQDIYTLNFLNADVYIKDTDLTHAFEIGEGPLEFKKNEKLAIQNFHPVWVVADKKPLNLGHLTDVHVSSRQHAFKKSKAKFIHGKSAEIGPMVNASFDSLKDLMDQFGKDSEIDLLVFTGDLIDYGRNYHPKQFIAGSKKTTGDIWQEMTLSNLNQQDDNGNPIKNKDGKILPNISDYPRSIDNVLIFSLFLYYYETYGKPIFLTSGNHECYSLPYGISSRIAVWRTLKANIGDLVTKRNTSQEDLVEESKRNSKKDMDEIADNGPDIYGMRANEGIAADHNLTLPEAILMYGPAYAEVVMGGGIKDSGRVNFNSKNLDWFYAVFTPISDYTFTWGKQCFMALQWGDSERLFGFLGDAQEGFGGGFLPRANKSISNKQRGIIAAGLANKKPCNVLFTHFTLTSYNQPVAITEKGSINIDDNNQHGKFDYGTFEQNRNYLYTQIATNKINYTLAGHSHRSALYQVTEFENPIKSEVYDDNDYYPNITTKGFVAKGNEYQGLNKNACKMIVSSCGGPIGIQNYSNELANWGLDNPSGSFIKFNDEGKEKKIGLVIPKVTKAAKPRLAVALDYADVFGPELKRGFLKENYGGVFRSFESNSDTGPFTLEINPRMKLPVKRWIKDITLHVFAGDTSTPITMKTELKGKKYELTPNTFSELERAIIRKRLVFLSLTTTADLTGIYSHYDQKSPWTFQVEVKSRTEEIDDDYYAVEEIPGYVIQRHSVNGEVPNHQHYTKIFDDVEYNYPWGTKIKSGDTK